MLSTMKVKNPHGLIVPDVQIGARGEINYREDRIRAVRSMRDDPLARLHDRGQIGEAQYLAGRAMQKLYEDSEVGRLRSQDPSNEPVDGGGSYPDIMSDRQLKALKRVNSLYPILGKEGSRIMGLMLAERKFAHEIAAIMGDKSQRGIDYIGRRIRECLTTLAREFGYA